MSEESKKDIAVRHVSGREMGALLQQLSKMVGTAPLSDRRLAKALSETGRYFAELGDRPYRDLLAKPEVNERKDRSKEDYSGADLKRVEKILNNPDSKRGQLIDLAASRFGISRPLLERKSVDAVRDEIRTAVRHESSISIISDVARRGDKRS